MFTIPLYDDNPTTTPPIVTVALIGLCAVVFLWMESLPPRAAFAATYSYGFVPAVLFGLKELPPSIAAVPPAATIVTSMFVHGGWMHILGNMLFLWIFGNNIEDALGHFRFVLFYFLCGIAAALAQALANPGSTTPMVGASGAIAGVLGAYLALFPRARVWSLLTFFFFIPIRLPAWLVLGSWFLLQWAYSAGLATSSAGGVAYMAHVVGFIAGLLIGLLTRGRPGAQVSRPTPPGWR
jgi:membrane associated rhomboid family serine protease